ncbi:MAG: VWA domain-containing protein, partial [Planctomycetota bacterium]|nr:VWA domain-containing protein [Planctomycetota bacterium]
AAQRALRDAVRDNGLGFWMSGGAGAFGPGGYHQTPVAQLLPVSFVQKEEKRDPSTTLVVIIDTSGSMGGTRVQLAKEVARLAIRRLLPHDKVGIVEFYGAKRWAAPIQPASNAIEIQRALNRLDAGGGTVIMPAIEESYYALQNVQTRFKHVLVLTDGGVEQGAFEPLLRKMAQKGVNVSAVLVGAQAHSEFLVSMANWGKGRFYAVPNRFNLPEILLKQPTTARLPAYRHGTHATRSRGGRGWWGNEGPVVTPPLDGYVELRRRRGAEVLLETVRGAHPLLATWRYGLGRVTTLATEPVGPGTRGWTQWPGYGAALARIWARTARRARPPFSYSLTRCDHRLRLVATRTVSGRVTPAAQRLGTAGAAAGSLAFDERADGVFVAEFTSAPADEVRIVAEAAGWPASRVRLCSTAFADVAPESMVDPTGAFDGALAAEQTGGAVLSLAGPDAAPSAGVGSALRLRELAPALLVLALLCFLADLALRRRSGLTTDNA